VVRIEEQPLTIWYAWQGKDRAFEMGATGQSRRESTQVLALLAVTPTRCNQKWG
jgi:hypothetical protein